MKMLEALHIYRDGEDGTHVIEHHHASDPPETHRFKERNQAVGHILSHVDRLEPQGSPEQEERPDSWSGRPASFDYGSTRVGEIEGRRK
jgi:hypothetical protein